MTARIRYFGTQPLLIDGKPYRLKLSGASRALFLFLLVNTGREWRREYLAQQFWPSSTTRRQKSCLNSAVWRIKNQFEPFAEIELRAPGHQLCLLLDSSVTIDLEELRSLVRDQQQLAIPQPRAARRLERLLHHGRTSWLEHVDGDWALVARERAFNLRLRGLTLLMHWHSSERRYEEALEIGRALVADDPTREALQCSVLWLYVLNGQRGQALRHYDQFRRWLNSDLGIEPMPETQALHDYIRRGLDGQHTTSAIARSSGRTGSDRQNNLPPLHRMVAAVEDSRRAFLENLGDRPE